MGRATHQHQPSTKMMTHHLFALLCLLAAASAFVPSAPSVSLRPFLRSKTCTKFPAPVMQEAAPAETETEAEEEAPPPPPPPPAMSASLPMLKQPEYLTGMAGDVGFDPMGFGEYLDICWLREAELKHARVTMLATLGYVAVDMGMHLPTRGGISSADAHNVAVENGSMSQILLWIGLAEVFGGIAIAQTLTGSGREPGDFGFDPLGFTSDESKKADLQEKELANGRLAMLAFSGIVTQSVLTGGKFPYVW